MSGARRVSDPVETVLTVYREFTEREVSLMAAGISYYAFVSLVPLFVVTFVVAVFVGGEALRADIQTLATAHLLPSGQEYVEAALEDRAGQESLGLIGVPLTVWGALKVFFGMDVAFSRIYGSQQHSILDKFRDAFLTLASIGVGIVGVVGASVAVSVVEVPRIGLLSPLLFLAALFVVFYPFYYVFPDVNMALQEAVPGAAFAAVGWTALGSLFGAYTQLSAGVAGAMGSILLLVTWFYLAGVLLLTGALLNAVLSGRLTTPERSAEHANDRQLQHPGERHDKQTDMSEDRADRTGRGQADVEPRGAPDISELEARVERLRTDLEEFETDVDERTVNRPQLEAELEQYVRERMRRGHARGWGPYLVLLYGTIMTLGAFYFLQDEGLYAIAAMIVIFLSTLGLYALFLLVGVGLDALELPGRAIDAVRERRR